jgi:hypothetical protein
MMEEGEQDSSKAVQMDKDSIVRRSLDKLALIALKNEKGVVLSSVHKVAFAHLRAMTPLEGQRKLDYKQVQNLTSKVLTNPQTHPLTMQLFVMDGTSKSTFEKMLRERSLSSANPDPLPCGKLAISGGGHYFAAVEKAKIVAPELADHPNLKDINAEVRNVFLYAYDCVGFVFFLGLKLDSGMFCRRTFNFLFRIQKWKCCFCDRKQKREGSIIFSIFGSENRNEFWSVPFSILGSRNRN